MIRKDMPLFDIKTIEEGTLISKSKQLVYFETFAKQTEGVFIKEIRVFVNCHNYKELLKFMKMAIFEIYLNGKAIYRSPLLLIPTTMPLTTGEMENKNALELGDSMRSFHVNKHDDMKFVVGFGMKKGFKTTSLFHFGFRVIADWKIEC